MAKNKEFAKLLRFAAATSVVFFTVGKALGYRPQDMLPSFQIGGAPPFKVPAAAGKAIIKTATAKDNSSSTRGEQLQKAYLGLGSAVGSTTIPGFAQGKKTVTGIAAVQRGKTKQGNSTIQVNQTPGNYAKAAAFGPYALHGQKTTAVAQAAQSNPLKDKAVMIRAFGKDFASLKNDGERKTWATKSQQNYDIYQNYLAAKKAFGAPNSLPASLPPNDQQLLHSYNRLTDQGKQNVLYTQKDYEYKLAQAQYDKARAQGTLSNTDEIRWAAKLQKAKVGSVYPKDVRDLHGLSKAAIGTWLSASEPGVDKQKLAKQLIAYDQALYNAGIIKTLKFKYGFESGSSGGNGSTDSNNFAAQLKFNAAKAAPKVVAFSGLPKAPAKYTAPGIKKYTPKTTPSKGRFTYSIRKGLL